MKASPGGQAVGSVSQEEKTLTGTVARIGGDEFAVIATAADEDAVKAAVEKLRNLCAEWDAKEEYPVSIAVGHAMQAGRTMTADELFMEADAAMYRNKAEIKKAVGGIIR